MKIPSTIKRCGKMITRVSALCRRFINVLPWFLALNIPFVICTAPPAAFFLQTFVVFTKTPMTLFGEVYLGRTLIVNAFYSVRMHLLCLSKIHCHTYEHIVLDFCHQRDCVPIKTDRSYLLRGVIIGVDRETDFRR